MHFLKPKIKTGYDLKCTCTLKIFLIRERVTVKKSIASTFREKCSSGNEIIHFKVLKGLRGDYPNTCSLHIAPSNPLQTAGMQ